MNDLESLLSANSSRTFLVPNGEINTRTSIQQSESNASLFDLIKMISKIVTVTMKDLDVEFIPDEGRQIITDPMKKIDRPYIAYKVISRKPKHELKPRVRQQLKEDAYDTDVARLGEVYGQKFECVVQFNVFASEYSTAEAVMERFEDMMLTYIGHFKKHGVGEILFKEQFTDETYNQFRQMISIRNLLYYVEIEKLTVIFRETLKEIETYKSL